MAKCYDVATCFDCPHYDHSGGYTLGGAIPLCGAVKDLKSKYKRKYLPYEYENDERVATGIIPNWCPLDDK